MTRGRDGHRWTALLLVALVAGCVVAPRPWTPVVDTYGDSRAQYIGRDLEECRYLALRVSGYPPQQGVVGALGGGLVGAAAGAAIGAALGNPGTGAAVGAAAGGVGSGFASAAGSDAAFRQAYANCMRGRGHNVVG